MTENQAIEIRTDPESPNAKVEDAALRAATLRATVFSLEKELAEARAGLAAAEARINILVGGHKKRPRKTVSDAAPRRGRPPRPPSEAHLPGLRLVVELGRIDKDALFDQIFKDRTTVRNRIRFWRKKGWIQENEDGSCTVQEGLLD